MSAVLAAPLALTMGEPAGIGGELTLQAWLRRQSDSIPPFVVLDDPQRLSALAQRLDWTVPLQVVKTPGEAVACFADALPILPLSLSHPVTPGQPDSANAAVVAESIARAVRLTQEGQTAAVVTNPIHKKVMADGGFRWPGHTEYLAHLTGHDGDEVMMLACPALRVVPITVHLALKQAIAQLTSERIITVARITAAALRRDFGLAQPRLALAGLNPHAGEDGAMGDEEKTIMAPAIAALRAEGITISDPLPADTLFHAEARTQYDVALCAYHDQALIPLKTLDFHSGVNITLGLPIVRTSPDHGTAFALAGTGTANPDSLIHSLRLADTLSRNRSAHG